MDPLSSTRTPKISPTKTFLLSDSRIPHSTFKPYLISFYSAPICSPHPPPPKRSLSFSICCCKLRTTQDKIQSKDSGNNNIVVSNEPAAPPLLEEDEIAGKSGSPAQSDAAASGIVKLLKRLPRRVLAVLSNLRLALGEMFAIAGLMALGMLFFSPFVCFTCL